MDVSIIIVNWNTCAILRDCLESVYQQTENLDFETIVIDNASSDDSVSMVREQFPQVRLIANQENRGFAAANNQGLEVASGRYVLLLNSDTIVLEGAIQKTVAFADQYPQAGVFGCRVLNPDRSLQQTCFMAPSLLNMLLSSSYLYKLFPSNRFFGRERMTWWQRDDQREVEVVTGCYLMVRGEALSQVGPLDEGFFMYGEETDWCCRFAHAGWKVLFTPEPQIIHLGGQSSRQVRAEMILQLRSGLLHFLKKHRSFPEYACACLLVSLWFALRVPYWFVRGVLRLKPESIELRTARVYLQGAVCSLFGWSALAMDRSPADSRSGQA